MKGVICRVCGGPVVSSNHDGVGECTHCGTLQVIPKQNDPDKIALLNDAGDFVSKSDYVSAEKLYLQALIIDPADPEIYWSIAMCRYGVQYVEDPIEYVYKPTLNRMQFQSIFQDGDYNKAIEYSNEEQKNIYLFFASQIEKVRLAAIALAKNEEPYDVFICYKETDSLSGRRSIDSILAQEIFNHLTKLDLRVFFARITLESKAGTDYEPYIFSALNSSRVMVIVTTSIDHINSVWVKNEWTRYQRLMDEGENKSIIPAYRDVSPKDLPKPLSGYQGVDLNRPDFLELIASSVLTHFDDHGSTTTIYSSNSTVNNILYRAFAYLEIEKWDTAVELAEEALGKDAFASYAFLVQMMAEFKVHTQMELFSQLLDLTKSKVYDDIINGKDKDLAQKLHLAVKKTEDVYQRTLLLMNSDVDGCYAEALAILEKMTGYKDVSERIEECKKKGAIQEKYIEANMHFSHLETDIPIIVSKKKQASCVSKKCYQSLLTAQKLLLEILPYRDSQEKYELCTVKLFEYKLERGLMRCHGRDLYETRTNIEEISERIRLLKKYHTSSQSNYFIEKADGFIAKANKCCREQEKLAKKRTFRRNHPILFLGLVILKGAVLLFVCAVVLAAIATFTQRIFH